MLVSKFRCCAAAMRMSCMHVIASRLPRMHTCSVLSQGLACCPCLQPLCMMSRCRRCTQARAKMQSAVAALGMSARERAMHLRVPFAELPEEEDTTLGGCLVSSLRSFLRQALLHAPSACTSRLVQADCARRRACCTRATARHLHFPGHFSLCVPLAPTVCSRDFSRQSSMV